MSILEKGSFSYHSMDIVFYTFSPNFAKSFQTITESMFH